LSYEAAGRLKETDRTATLGRRLHQLSDRVEYHLELAIVSILKLGQLAGQIGVACHQLPQAARPNLKSQFVISSS
jgi:hypothetical protein